MGEVSRDSSHPNRESLGQLNTLQEYRYAGSPHLDSPMIRGSLNDYQTNHRTNQHVRHVSGDTSYFYEEPGTSFTNYTIGQTITDYRATTTRQTSHESFAADNVIESQEVGLPVFQEKRKSLADIHKPEEIQNLPIREMESLLAKYEIKTAPGMETGHLVELVTRLWNKRQSQGKRVRECVLLFFF